MALRAVCPGHRRSALARAELLEGDSRSPSQAHAQGDASCLAPYASSRAWLGVERSYVHAHADELGAPCLGSGPRERLRFDVEEVARRRGARYGPTIRQRESPLRPALLSASATTRIAIILATSSVGASTWKVDEIVPAWWSRMAVEPLTSSLARTPRRSGP
jgi:hypothetical protein